MVKVDDTNFRLSRTDSIRNQFDIPSLHHFHTEWVLLNVPVDHVRVERPAWLPFNTLSITKCPNTCVDNVVTCPNTWRAHTDADRAETHAAIRASSECFVSCLLCLTFDNAMQSPCSLYTHCTTFWVHVYRLDGSEEAARRCECARVQTMKTRWYHFLSKYDNNDANSLRPRTIQSVKSNRMENGRMKTLLSIYISIYRRYQKCSRLCKFQSTTIALSYLFSLYQHWIVKIWIIF